MSPASLRPPVGVGGPTAGLTLPVLIEVPALRPPGVGRRPLSSRRRRRLRREVRVGGAAVLLGMPMLLVGLSLGEARLPWRSGLATEAVDSEPPPAVLLSPELVPASYPGEKMPEVRASGYLLPELPDERAEEPPHAGT